MKRLEFTDSSNTDELFDKGYKVFPLLNEEAVNSLKTIFNKHHKHTPEGFYASTHLENKALRKEISDEALSIIQLFLKGKFQNIDVLGGAFISKAPGERGVLPLHQDWNIVDEKIERSYNLWIPLQDVNEENGAMRVLENSHLKLETFRGPKSPPILYSISDYVNDFMLSVNMKAGEALIYDHALWHSSPINQTTELRLALVMGVVTQNAQLRYYQQEKEEVLEYKSYPTFFFENDREGGAGDLSLISKIPHKNVLLSKEEFDKVYLESSGNSDRNTFLQKIKSFLGV